MRGGPTGTAAMVSTGLSRIPHFVGRNPHGDFFGRAGALSASPAFESSGAAPFCDASPPFGEPAALPASPPAGAAPFCGAPSPLGAELASRLEPSPPSPDRPPLPLTSTLAPPTRRVMPSTTTLSPAESPLLMMLSLPCVRATTTGRVSTVESGLTTNTYCCPCWP